jgi:hypothetical protein
MNNFKDLSYQQMKLEQEMKKQYADKHKQLVRSTPFPDKKLNRDWLRAALNALPKVSIVASMMEPAIFKSLCSVDIDEPKLTYEQIAGLCNLFETLSADQLGMHILTYCAYQEVNVATSKVFNDWDAAVIADLEKQFQDEMMANKKVQNDTPLMKPIPQA